MVEPLNVWDYERLAAERLEPGAHGYYAGGAGDELTLGDNVEAFRRWQLRPRMLVDVETCTTATTVLGQDVSMPLLVAPVAFQRVAHPDGEVGMARAAKAAGTIMCLSTLATSAPAEVAAVDGPRWFQLYVFRDEGVTRDLIAQAREGGFGALVLTIDAPVRGNRERDARTAFAIPADISIAALGKGGLTPREVFDQISPSLTWRDLERLCAESDLPLLVKGVLTEEDATLACEHGASGIVVSNHGGRQLDGVSATIDALEEVVAAVDGRVEVLLDGGIRRGTDVVKALALGAARSPRRPSAALGPRRRRRSGRPASPRAPASGDPRRAATDRLHVPHRRDPRPRVSPYPRGLTPVLLTASPRWTGLCMNRDRACPCDARLRRTAFVWGLTPMFAAPVESGQVARLPCT